MRNLPLVLSLVCISAFADITPEKFQEIKKKAEQGDPTAQYDLGLCYDIGDGVAEDSDEAIKWYMKAAKNRSLKAKNNSGTQYDFTTNVLWQSYDMTGPKKPTIKSVNWRLLNGMLMVQEVESKEWVKCIYQAQKSTDEALAIIHSGKVTNGRHFSISIILRKEKFYYSLATLRGDTEHITYGPCSDELEQYFWGKLNNK